MVEDRRRQGRTDGFMGAPEASGQLPLHRRPVSQTAFEIYS